MPTRLIALDIDGTLIPPGAGHDALPDEAIRTAVADLARAGVVVVLASGRMFPGTARVARHLCVNRPMICQQGASIHETNGAITHRFAIDPEIARELVAYAREHRWTYAWFDAVRYLASAPNHASTEYGLVSGIEPEYDPSPEDSAVIPTGIDVISTQADANRIHGYLEAHYGDRLHLLDFPTVTAAHSPDASKGKALALLAADLGIASSDVVAIGDSVNDVSMLRWAGRGVTLPHGDRYARDAADERLPGEGIEGVAPFLRSLLREDR